MGYSYSTPTYNERTLLTTWPQTVFSPATGEAGNLLTPGVYIVSIYAYLFFSGASSTSSAFTVGIGSNTSTNPAGFTNVNSITLGIGINPIGSGTYAYWPCFVFSVPSNAYYYTYVSSIAGSLNAGSYGIGARTTSIVRIA